MNASRHVVKYAKGRLVRKMMRSMPWLGAVVALATLGSALKRKGVVGGTIDTALDMLPFVGMAKNTAEAVRGRDFIRDRSLSRSSVSAR
jgi:hypothetical protein